MIITLKLTETQLRQVNNLMQNCSNKQDMFDHLFAIGINAFHSILMSNSFEKIKADYCVIPLHKELAKREYKFNGLTHDLNFVE